MFRNMSSAMMGIVVLVILLVNLLLWSFLSYRGVGAYTIDTAASMREQSVNGVGLIGGGPGSGK